MGGEGGIKRKRDGRRGRDGGRRNRGKGVGEREKGREKERVYRKGGRVI